MLSIHTLVFPTDDSPAAEAARPFAERLAARHGATLHVLRVDVVPPAGNLRFDPIPEPDREVDGVIEARRRFPTAADAITTYADQVDADLIVLGTHGRSGFARLTIGSTAERVLRQAPCPVVTIGPSGDIEGTGPVLIPVAFESFSEVALDTAVAVASSLGTGVVALHVIEPIDIPVPYAMTIPPFDKKELSERVEKTLSKWVSGLADGPVPVTTEIRHGHASEQILESAAENGAQIIVQASHGRKGLGRWFLGSVAEEVARRAPCPVLTLRADARQIVQPDGEAETLPVPRDEWSALFDALSARATAAPHEVSLTVVSPEAEGTIFRSLPLVGITYDPRADELVVMVQGSEHHVVRPFSVRSTAGGWALDAVRDASAPGPWALDVVGADGTRERISIRAVGDAVTA